MNVKTAYDKAVAAVEDYVAVATEAKAGASADDALGSATLSLAEANARQALAVLKDPRLEGRLGPRGDVTIPRDPELAKLRGQ